MEKKFEKRIGIMQLGLIVMTIFLLVFLGTTLPTNAENAFFIRLMFAFVFTTPVCIPFIAVNLVMGINILDGKKSYKKNYRIKIIFKFVLSFVSLLYLLGWVLWIMVHLSNIPLQLAYLLTICTIIAFCCALFILEMTDKSSHKEIISSHRQGVH